MKILPCGVAVIEGDTHISKWVEDARSISIADIYLHQFRTLIRPGSSVIDAGAMIGDHTSFYAKQNCVVFAFEPNPQAFECLEYNTRNLENVSSFNCALSNCQEEIDISILENAGASYLQRGLDGGVKVKALPLDYFAIEDVSFVKIDVEGFEPYVLLGANKTISEYRPFMLIEVNSAALERVGSSRNELLDLIDLMGYNWRITDRKISVGDPQYDVICTPRNQ
jgi:FkbM family methyltransferase